MRIVHLLVSDGFGGAERVATTLHRCLREAGHDSRIEAPRLPDIATGLRRDLGDSLPFVELRESTPWAWDKGVRARLRASLPDVVHVHLPSPSYLGRALAIVGRLPAVMTFHLLPPARFPADRALKIPSPWVLWASARIRSRLHFATVARGDAIRLAALVPPSLLHCVPNAPPLPPERDEETGPAFPRVPAAVLRLLVVGRLVAQKGCARLLTALTHPRVRDLPFTLAVIGDGPERSACEGIVAAGGLGEKVRFFGARPAHRAFAEADLLILPSRFEGLPLVLLEGLMAQLPVLASSIPPHREVLGPSSLALLPDEESAWPERLEEILLSPALRASLADACRACVPRSPHERLLMSYLEIYGKAQARSTKARASSKAKVHSSEFRA
ncbi:MAG: glycosyltransferase family 4 protein [Deltaproteobacteria bacterium]|nr:glycosyltransferase family 4 protein [Deltaproteobacteria bacterium]